MRLHLQWVKTEERLPEVGSRFLVMFEFVNSGGCVIVEYRRVREDCFEEVTEGIFRTERELRNLFPLWLEILDTDTGKIAPPTRELFYSLGGMVVKTKDIEEVDADAD